MKKACLLYKKIKKACLLYKKMKKACLLYIKIKILNCKNICKKEITTKKKHLNLVSPKKTLTAVLIPSRQFGIFMS